MSVSLTTKIAIRDQRGNVVDEKEVATYAGLLARAHEEGLKMIATALIQVPNEQNGHMAIASAVVETGKGRFTGIGDASPDNVSKKIAPHIIRMAETRAKARALRDAVNIGVVALEELGGDMELAPDEREAPPSGNVRQLKERREGWPAAAQGADERRRAADTRGPTDTMTEAQRKLLFRLLTEQRHVEHDHLAQVLCHEAAVENLRDITKRQASSLIDAWTRQETRRGA